MITALLILLPLVLAALMLFAKPDIAKRLAVGFSLAEVGLFVLATHFFTHHAKNMTQLNLAWLPFGANFSVGLDGISYVLVLLTVVLIPFILLTVRSIDYNSRFYALVFIMQAALIGVFVARDGFLFYIFWELALIPIYFICLAYGDKNRRTVTLKFFIYTTLGSLLMLVGLLYVYFSTPGAHSFDIQSLYAAGHELSSKEQTFVFWMIFSAFAIKMPIFPFHTWQPDTYVSAPTQGTMLLSGIMLKMGTYGMIRWLIPMVPQGYLVSENIVLALCVISVVYASCLALVQTDFKRLIAYSSIAHVGLIAAGLTSFNLEGITGGVVQMFAHGITVVGLFYIAQIIQQRTQTSTIGAFGGLRNATPHLAVLFLIVLLGSVALPLTNGFVGEFLLINGIFQVNPWLAGVAGLTVILGAVYMLRSYQTMMLGNANLSTTPVYDLDQNETLVLIACAFMILFFGIFPSLLTNIITPDVAELMKSFQEGLIH